MAKARISFDIFLVLLLGTSSLLSSPRSGMAGTRFQEPRRVLLLNSYHKGYQWTDEITRGVEEVFAGKDIELHVEYMDTKRQFGYLYRTFLYRLLSIKHIKHSYDAVITADDNAFDFFREFRKRIADVSPQVFCGVNYLSPETTAAHGGLTGVNERADIPANLTLIQRLHPQAKTVLVVTDNTPTGRIVQAEVTRLQKAKKGLTIDLVYDVTIDELGQQLRDLDPHTIVLYTFFFKDKDQRFFEYNTSAKFVAAQTPGPVYCAWGMALGFGGVGGYMVDGYSQGEVAARKVLQILGGTPVDDIPVQWATPIVLRFDYRQLRAHGISLDKLPPGAEIINQPVSFYYRYKSLIWNAVIVFVGLGLALAGAVYGLIRVRASEKKVAQSEYLHRSLFEKTNDAIFILDERSGKCLDANQVALDITGRSLGELKKLTVKDLSPQSEQRWLASARPAKRAVDLGQVIYFTPDTRKIARVSSVYLDDNRVMAIAKDMTHDLEMENQLRQAQKMEAIGTLAGGIAHDFNNILSGIYSYSQLAQMNITQNPSTAHSHISQVIKAVKRASELVHQILTFSRQADPQVHHIEISPIVEETIKFLRSSIPTSIEISDRIKSQAWVLADPIHIHQVVMNLGTNAYHAMRDSGGQLTMILEDLTLSEDQIRSQNLKARPGPHVKLEVRDTGHGMDAKTLSRIFDPYFTTKKTGEGTGMGLSVVDGIIKQHGGFFRVSSQINKGTIFQVFWPVSDPEEAVDEVEESLSEPLTGSGRILVVDDEPSILNTMKSLLESRGYTVSVKASPLKALALFEENPQAFDLLITDMTMPKMSGTLLSEKILAIRGDMPIILCSGHHEMLSKADVIAMGIGRYLEKPVMTRDLHNAINTLLDP